MSLEAGNANDISALERTIQFVVSVFATTLLITDPSQLEQLANKVRAKLVNAPLNGPSSRVDWKKEDAD